MKVLLVAEKDSTKESLLLHLVPRGFDLIHYRNPIKAMDNIDEIAPDAVFFSAEDFPRHWKPFLKLLRVSFTKENTTFVLLKGDLFPFEEAAKAKHLDVTGIIRENLEDRKEYSRLEELLSRYTSLKEVRSVGRYIPGRSDQIEFVFTHPDNRSIITGSIFDLSPTGAAFEPDDPDKTKGLAVGTEIHRCSLRIEDEYFTLTSKIIRNDGRLAVQFLDIGEKTSTAISDFIERKAERELKSVLREETANT
ncbi:MAG: PilZ domain-containing protein [Spirochaetales bacterium]|nr:PilZ domain-containing protein [Spirochaetales bacterium]